SALVLCGLALAGLIVPACGGDHPSKSTPPGGSSPATPLFSEPRSRALPGTDWSATCTLGRGASVQVDAADGNPAPSLALTTTSAGSFVGTTTTLSFESRPSTFTVQMSSTGSGEGSGGF